MAILIGTDYNPDGIKGIGPKRAYNLIKQYNTLENVLKHLPEAHFPVSPQIIREAFLKPEVTDNYTIKWMSIDRDKVIEILVEEHDFSKDRVEKALNKVEEALRKTGKQTGLDQWF
jgi:flap endonuclease-1